ncbi:SAM-dependent methyltransferase [Luedemannella helvata]|uniref:SAM-dependent methyltransferase n=1 Tax=Luedemannella helvata TaxID=349315 RepID=A0ABN2JXH5_9ACTN
MTNEQPVPPGVDATRPSVARVYDWFLGGKDNFAIDREVAKMALKITPDGPAAGRANRAFLRRVVRYLVVEAGVRQFIDIGSGLPTQGNVHEVANKYAPDARVIYVDNDPMVLAHGRALLDNATTATVIQADAKDPASILNHPEVVSRIDFSQPVGILLFAILHHLRDDEDPLGVAAALRAPLVAGSHLAISHFRDPGPAHPEASAKALQVEKIFNETMGTGRWRKQEEILAYFGDTELLEPGLVPLAEWRPDPGEEPVAQSDTYYTFVGGLSRKN